jgi:hypothetical protein
LYSAKIDGAAAESPRTAVRMSKAELLDIATMLGMFFGFIAVIALFGTEVIVLP